MYKFTVFDNDNCDIKYQGTNGTGQTMRLTFAKYYYPKKRRYDWFVVFDIVDKKKHKYHFRQQTGTDGIKSLLWAKECLKDFIENQIRKDVDNAIIIYWDDSQRKRVYARGLQDLGFRMTNFDNKLALVKFINTSLE